MGNLNLLNEDDFLEQPGRPSKTTDSSQKYISENDLFDDIMVERKQIEEEESVIDANLEAYDEEDTEPENDFSDSVIPKENENTVTDDDDYRKASKIREQAADDLSFESTEPKSKKLLWIILILVIIATSGYFVYTKYSSSFFSPTKENVVEEKAIIPTTEEARITELQTKRNQKFKELAKETAARIDVFTELFSKKTTNSRIEVIIINEDEILFEVLSKTRDGLALLNIELKKIFPVGQIEVIASRNRPGDKGGVVASYRVIPGKIDSQADAASPFTDFGMFKKWLDGLAATEKVKISRLELKNSGPADGFDVKKIDLMLNGTTANIAQLLGKIGNSGKNFSVANVKTATSVSGSTKLEIMLKLYL